MSSLVTCAAAGLAFQGAVTAYVMRSLANGLGFDLKARTVLYLSASLWFCSCIVLARVLTIGLEG